MRHSLTRASLGSPQRALQWVMWVGTTIFLLAHMFVNAADVSADKLFRTRSPQQVLDEELQRRSRYVIETVGEYSQPSFVANEKYRNRQDFVAAQYYASMTTKTWGRQNSPFWDGHSYVLTENDVPSSTDIPLAARYTPEQDCRVCTMWVHAAVAWLPTYDEFGPDEVQTSLLRACNDTWLIHDPDLRLERLKADDNPSVAAKRTWDHRARCERMFREDAGQEALYTIWTMWDHLQPVGGLPQAVCCRLDYCPCTDMADEGKQRFYSGIPSLTAPLYIP